MEPSAKTNVRDDGKFYSWEGKRTGEGEMKITNEISPKSLDIDLTFLKPWKSKSKVRFEIDPKGDESEVTWYMDGSLPIFMFWMKKMMEAFVGMDYVRGLNLLKDYIEDGEVHSKIAFDGKTKFGGCKYLGITTECTMDEVGVRMQDDFKKLGAWAQEHSEELDGNPFSIYHKWDMVSGKVQYTSGFPVKNIPESPVGFVKGEIPETPVNTVTHIGPYVHLGNAWSTQYNMKQNKEFKINKNIDPFEIYLNMPGEVDELELKTQVHFPVK